MHGLRLAAAAVSATAALVSVPATSFAAPPSYTMSVDSFQVTSAVPGGVEPGYCWASFAVGGVKPTGSYFALVSAQGSATGDGTRIHVTGRPGAFSDTGRLLVASGDAVTYTVTLENRTATESVVRTFASISTTCAA
ncbi:MAG TPA: hypothetical protein VFJ17_02325 [Mycobacteriales bacterium]|jgi:hypothetical protein|nr:hypothetical protein [Mycobacteriales bacterium]